MAASPFLRGFFAITLALAPLITFAELVVVVHPNSPVQTLTLRQVSDLYLGRVRSLSAGSVVEIVDQPRDSVLRKEFFQRINGMPIQQVNAYWARLQFSGEVQPPVQVDDSRAVIDEVRRHPNAIGYVDDAYLTNDVRPVLYLKK